VNECKPLLVGLHVFGGLRDPDSFRYGLDDPQFGGRVLHSSTFQLNLSRFGPVILSPCLIDWGKPCTKRIPQNVLTLTRKVNECKPLFGGRANFDSFFQATVLVFQVLTLEVGTYPKP